MKSFRLSILLLLLIAGSANEINAQPRHPARRHDQRHESAPVVLDRTDQLGSRRTIEPVLEISRHVLEHVGVPPRRGDRFERAHETFGVLGLDLAGRPRNGDEAAERARSAPDAATMPTPLCCMRW